MPEIVHLPIESVFLYREFQPRVEQMDDDGYVSPRHVQEFLNSDPSIWPPILVMPHPERDESYLVLDGFHRVTAAILLDLSDIAAVIVPDGGYYEAFAANRDHGLPLSTADRKAFARWLYRQRPDLSLRQLGREACLSPHTVKAALEPLQDHGETNKRRVQSAHPPVTPNRAAANLLRSVQHLWDQRHSLPGDGSESTAIFQLADAIRAAVAREPDERQALYWLRTIIDAALSS